MIEALRSCGGLARILPEVDALFGVPQPPAYHPEVDTGLHILLVLDYAAARSFPLAVRFAALTHDLGKGTRRTSSGPATSGTRRAASSCSRASAQRLRVPSDCRELAVLVTRHHGEMHRAEELRPSTIVKLLEKHRRLAPPRPFRVASRACASDFHGRPGFESRPYAPAPLLRKALEAARCVDAGAIARSADRTARRLRQRCTRRACTRSSSWR